ncbi:MAG: chromosomal replication initiator protein DnaA [Dehalococcoidales bacterium]|nr:chromosomal replication initiator protein DnaA [Dehalococcoidales bacterium]
MDDNPAQQIWETALGELQVQVSKHNYQTWLEKTTGISYQDKEFVIGVPNSFIAEYLDQNQRSLIKKTLIGIIHHQVNPVFRINNGYHHADEKTSPTSLPASSPFNPRYTLDSFITGDSNRLAYAAAAGVANNPKASYNPLFIYGGVGLGKTHLLHGIGQQALANHLRVCYVSGEQFTNEFITALQENQLKLFHSKYRRIDILLVDDIQFISGKERTEECFFHTFNELYNTNHQIVVTSDHLPKSIPRLTERLRSRFEGGLVTDIQPPDFETRLAILQSKSQQKGEAIAQDTLETIAQQLQQNIRELEGNLNRVIAYARLLQRAATPELATEALRNITNEPTARVISSQWIEAVANSFQLTPADLKGLKRDKNVALARQLAMYLIRQETRSPLVQIGRELGKRNPSTVKYACERIAAEIDINPQLRRRAADIRHQVLSE